MNLQRIKHMLLRLSTEEKVLGAGALTIIISSFMPWYSVILNYNERMTTESGFTGDLGVIGFVVFILVLIALAFLMSGYLHFKMPKFGYRKEQILLFLMGESAFLLLLTIAIYTKRSIEYTNAGIRFGLYISLIGAFMGVFAAYSQNQKIIRKETHEFFGTDGGDMGPSSPETEPSTEPDAPKEKTEKPAKHHTPKSEQKSFFHEETPAEETHHDEQAYFAKNDGGEDMYDDTQDENEIDEVAEVTPDDEIAEITEVDETAEETIRKIESSGKIPEDLDKFLEEDDIEKPVEQSNYFMKEAGITKSPNIKVDIESIKPVEKKPAKETAAKENNNEDLGFYDDL